MTYGAAFTIGIWMLVVGAALFVFWHLRWGNP